jgi:hypothetical protein
MDNNYNYDDIRPYNDSEVHSVFERLTKEPELITILQYAFPDKPVQAVIDLLLSIHSVYDFQSKIVGPFFLDLVKKTSVNLSISGSEKINPEKKYLFISNHRDIILDAALLNTLFITKKIETAENAIGDNLCVNQWITEGMKLNKNFIVQRSGTKREIFEASRKLSSYIRRNIEEKRNSVWIAQREGRAKDSNDRTQESLLKMLSMSGGKDLKQNFLHLNIMPVSISYEYDPCDYLKAKEFQQKRDNPGYKKTKEDDLLNMKTGLMGYKGRIHYEIVEDINNILESSLSESDDRTVTLEKIASIIDQCIHKNYNLYPSNYIALDILTNKNIYLDINYTLKEKEKFIQYIYNQIEKIELTNKDIPFLENKILEMYANPLINYLKTIEK